MRLPLELWSNVCCFLDPADLVKVARTSSHCSAAARPVLYQSVYLRSDKGGVQATFVLLSSDQSLARKVTNIHIFTAWQKDGEEKSWLDLRAFSNLTQLQSMTMTASPFRDAEEQDAFFKIVTESCSFLKEFTYRQGHYPAPYMGLYPTQFQSRNFYIQGIERLIWDDQASLLMTHPQLHSLMNASLQTIVHLAIPAELDDLAVEEAISFFHFRFPRLRTLELGGWIDVNGDAGPTALTKFLVAHPTIQDLALKWDDGSEYTSELSANDVTPNMLPNLRKLRSHAFNVLVILHKGVRFLGNLEKLSVGHGLHSEAEYDIDEMLERLISRGGLPRLKTLHFDPGEGCTDLENTEKWMSQWSRICPGLQKWSGSLADMHSMELDTLLSNFSRFPGLTQIELSYSILRRGVEDATKVASKISSLRKLTICPAGELNIRRATYHIQRNSVGTVSGFIVRKHSVYNKVTTTYHSVGS